MHSIRSIYTPAACLGGSKEKDENMKNKVANSIRIKECVQSFLPDYLLLQAAAADMNVLTLSLPI